MGDYALLDDSSESKRVMKQTIFPESRSVVYGTQVNPVELACPNSYISDIYLRGANVVDHIGVKCANSPAEDVSYFVKDGYDISGNDLWAPTSVQDNDECRRLCSAHPECKMASYSKSQKNCYLKAPSWSNKHHVVWKRPNGSMETQGYGEINSGNSYNTFGWTWKSDQQCEDACKNDPECWTASRDDSNGNCWLHKPLPNSDVIFSVKNPPDYSSGTNIPPGAELIRYPKVQELGAWGGSPTSATTKDGFAVVGIKAGSAIDRLSVSNRKTTDMVQAGGAGGTQYYFNCPDPSQVLTKITASRSDNIIGGMQFLCDFKINCDDYKKVFSPDCQGWKSRNENDYLLNARKLCSEGSNMELVSFDGVTKPCQDFCRKNGCDSSMMAYCGQFTPEQIIKEKKLCGCFMDSGGRDTFYSDFISTVAKGDPLAIASITDKPNCVYPPCADALSIKKQETIGGPACKSTELTQCLTNINFNADVSDSDISTNIINNCGNKYLTNDCIMSEWGACSKACGGGTKTRTVLNPAKGSGKACEALSEDCNIQACGTTTDPTKKTDTDPTKKTDTDPAAPLTLQSLIDKFNALPQEQKIVTAGAIAVVVYILIK
jgi:hypothetical protein